MKWIKGSQILSDTSIYMDTLYGPINFRINGVSVLKGLTFRKKKKTLSAMTKKTVRNNEVSALSRCQ